MRLMSETQDFRTRRLPREYDELAPDGSEIRVLLSTGRGQLTHCTLHPGETSRAISHRTVEEIWYCLEGQGKIWRRRDEAEQVVEFKPGVCVSITPGTSFQFRNTGQRSLEFIIATIPPWPGDQEAAILEGLWD